MNAEPKLGFIRDLGVRHSSFTVRRSLFVVQSSSLVAPSSLLRQ